MTDPGHCTDCGDPLPADVDTGETLCEDCKALREDREARDWAEAEGNE